MIRTEEEHARLMLAGELGVELRHHDDGSKPGMPDLLSVDGKHVAEVITTARSAVRKAQQHLPPIPAPTLPHCVSVLIPYTIVGGTTKRVRQNIAADVRQLVAKTGCEYHWSSRDRRQSLEEVDPAPILGLVAFSDGVRVLCVQRCHHPEDEPHQIRWTVTHEASPDDPWTLIRRSLHIVNEEQHGGVQSLADKLNGYPNKHLVMYPFGPPGNLTAAFGTYVPPANPLELMPPRLNPPLADIHLWLLYQYGNRDVLGGLHVCSGHWGKFGALFPKLDQSPLGRLHYRDA
jgi:hypothetical protein